MDYFQELRKSFVKKRVDENRDDDICMSDIVECLREMGYEPEEGSRKTILKFNFDDVYYEIWYENLRLIIRIYIFDRRPELLKLYKATSDAVNDELMMVRSVVRVSGENTILEIC